MLVDDYKPTKRLGVEECEGLQNLIDNRLNELAINNDEDTAQYNRLQGAWLAVHLLLTGRFVYPDDFMAVFDNKCDELF